MARVGRSVRISGRVQGVFFRAWTVEQARELGVAGWVRNCPDGSVEAYLSGEQAQIAQLIERLRNGPLDAEVERLDAEEVPADDGDRFEVRH